MYKEDLLMIDNVAECTVLLKTDGSFPVEKGCNLAAYGAGLRYSVKGGTGSGEVNTGKTETIEEGLEAEGFKILTKDWLDEFDEVRIQAKKNFVKDLKKEAKEKHENAIMYAMGKEMKEPEYDISLEKKCDTAIYVVRRNAGEGSDREAVKGDVKLTDSEVRDILKANELYERFMLVLNVSGVIDLSPVKDVKNILVLSQLGTDNGRVLAQILYGGQNPSGKLTTTWATWEEYSKEGTFGDWNDNLYKEGIFVGYRYFDTFGKKALFPFGFGLSYTTFAADDISVNADGPKITANVKVTNTGNRAGKEVAQVYVSLPEGRLCKAFQELAGFAKTKELAPGEAQELKVEFDLTDLASYDEENAKYILEKGDYIVRVGTSSADTKVSAVLTLSEDTDVRKVKNVLGKPSFTDIKPEAGKTESIPEDVTRITLDLSGIKCEEVIYDREYEIDKRVADLSDEELSYLAIGSFGAGGALSIIGNAATHLAGAAGETTSKLTDKGIKPLIMADGPAGLRVAREYYEDEKGAHSAGGAGMIPESMLEVMGPVTRFFAKMISGSGKVPKNAVIKQHNATMIPVGTAVAQSFNTDLARSFGDIVGKEMEEMGVNLWLAPALNIHRSILCGRNFEYYSEDPLVSGLMAAAITEGVQKHKGCGTTIKHYAANNAETNRYCNNSQVSERAMREIYLRGFEICVKKAQPHALMTSYNLLNGTHTSEHRGLIEDILRSEFGFKGIVMTDWVIDLLGGKKSIYRNALSDKVAAAGGDLFMPGVKKDYDNVLKALKDGSLSRKQLEINGTRVVKMSEKLLG
jgi:beta-glucosidase